MKTYLSDGTRVSNGYFVQTRPTEHSSWKIDSYGPVTACSEISERRDDDLIPAYNVDAVVVEPKGHGISKRFGIHDYSISKASRHAKSIGLSEFYDVRQNADVPSSFFKRLIKLIF